MAESSENEGYELDQVSQVDSSQSAFGDDIIGTKPTWNLPPKALLARSQISFSLSIVIPTLVAAFFLAAPSVLLSKIWFLLPDRDVPGGSISCDLVTGNASAFEDVFTIDLRSQLHLSFATAKCIDVVWDLVVGQKGRFLLAWISYVVFMDGLARLMETSAVSYQFYAATVFETSSLISI